VETSIDTVGLKRRDVLFVPRRKDLDEHEKNDEGEHK